MTRTGDGLPWHSTSSTHCPSGRFKNFYSEPWRAQLELLRIAQTHATDSQPPSHYYECEHCSFIHLTSHPQPGKSFDMHGRPYRR